MCTVDGCDRPIRNKAQGLCNSHYLRLRRYGDPTIQKVRRYGPEDRCEAPGCDARPLARGLCRSHYERQASAGEARPQPTVMDRFWASVEKTDTCWLWTGSLTRPRPRGYGQLKVNGQSVTAHRFSYETFVGPVPEGMQLDHLCRVRQCVRPDHLEPVTGQVNYLRGVGLPAQQARQTHCKRGHPLSGDNVRMVNGGRSRRCMTCRRAQQRVRSGA